MSDEKINPSGEMAAELNVKPEDIHLPPPSFWPIVLAFGFCCILGGLALNIAMALSGVIITLVAAIGWVIEPIHPEEEHH